MSLKLKNSKEEMYFGLLQAEILEKLFLRNFENCLRNEKNSFEKNSFEKVFLAYLCR